MGSETVTIIFGKLLAVGIHIAMERRISATGSPMASRISILLIPLLLASGATPAHGQTGPPEYRIDHRASHIYVVTHRSGLLSFLGHEHAILAVEWSADLCYDEARPAASRAVVSVDTRTLVADTDSVRALAGLGGGPGEEDRREIQHKLLDDERLAAERHPELRFQTTSIGEGPGPLPVRGLLTIRGVTREVDVPLRLESAGDGGVRLEGTLRVKQSDYGIRPESVAGVIRVSDDVDIHVLLTAVPTGRACPVGEADEPRRLRAMPRSSS